MALILNIDTATGVCSVALAREGRVVAMKENDEGLNHSTLLGVYVDEVLRQAGVTMAGVDAVAVSAGPGSYTGLRIGVSLAKGLCYGAGKPLIAVGTLESMADAVADRVREDALYCPMIDARRMEVYAAVYDREGREVTGVRPVVLDESAFVDELSRGPVYFFGDGSGKARGVLTHPNARFLSGVTTSAVNLMRLAERKFAAGEFEDVAYFEPFYLKEFVATVPKRKLF